MCVPPGNARRRQRAMGWSFSQRATECQNGTTGSDSPWRISVGATTFPILETFRNMSRKGRSLASVRDTVRIHEARPDMMMQPPRRPALGNPRRGHALEDSLLARYVVGPEPRENPIRMMCSGLKPISSVRYARQHSTSR